MNRSTKGASLSLTITVIAAALSSFSLCLIPFTSGFEEGKSNIFAYCIAAAFWLGWIVMLVAAHITKRKLSLQCKKLIANKSIKIQRLPGIISFSFDWRNIILYAITVIGFVVSVTDILFSYVPEMIMFPIISVTILSFEIHCVVDGKYYKVYQRIKESVKK